MENMTDFNRTEPLEDLNNRYAEKFIPFTALMAVMALIGIIGNIVVMFVFCLSKEYKYTNYKIFVLCLALLDLLSCVTAIPAEIAYAQTYFSIPNATSCKLKCFFNVFCKTAAGMALLTICIDRFRKVCQPLKKQIYPGLALKIVIFAMVFSFMLALPAPIMCGISPANKKNIYNTNTTVYLCTAEKQYQRSIVRIIYKFGLTILLFGVSITLIIMYIMIGRIVIRHMRSKRTMGSFRIESNKSPDPSEKIENDIVAEEVAVGEPGSPVSDAEDNNVESVKYTPKKDKKLVRKGSSFSISSNSIKAKLSISKRKEKRSISQDRASAGTSSSSQTRVPYKTLIWLVLTVIFVVTYFFNAILSFFTSEQYLMTPEKLLIYMFLFRIYFINSIINPIIYAWLDQRFRTSCKNLFYLGKT